MDRRKFFLNSSLLGGAICFLPGYSATIANQTEESAELKKKVLNAMLCMQRASWEQGVAAQAMLESGNNELLYLMAKEAVLRQTSEGRLSVVYTDGGALDPACSGEAVWKAYKQTGEEYLKLGAEKMLAFLIDKAPRSTDGILYHTMKSPEIWSDAMYMAPPFLAAMGKYNESLRQIEGFRKALWNPEKKLFSHRWDDAEKKFINQRFWGGGNGWAAACYSRIIISLPAEMKAEKEQLIKYHIDLLDGCIAFQREDGLFHDFVNEPETFIEVNLGQMLAYSIFRGIKGGWLDQKYLAPAIAMRNAAYKQIDQHGFVNNVCGAPSFNSPGRSSEGQAFFLLMEAAWNDMQ